MSGIFAQRLKEFREMSGLSMVDLAKRSGVSRGYLHLLERGENSPTYDKMELIAKALNVPVSEFYIDGTIPTLTEDESALIYALRCRDYAKVLSLISARIAKEDTPR